MANPFFSRERFFILNPLRKLYALFFILFFFITEFGRKVYRPYIYKNGINDLGFADVIGNLLGTLTIIFFELSLTNATKKQALNITLLVTTGITLYELLQPILPRGTLDWKDVVATIVAGILTLGILLLIWSISKDPQAN
jgi:hypothetical protein